MAHWVIKAAIHRGISVLPNRQFWNGLLQKWITRSTELTPGAFTEKARECSRHLRVLRSVRPEQDFTALELGTGWLPILPVGLWVCGAREVWTFDIDPLLKTERVLGVLRNFSEYAERGALSELVPEARADRLGHLESVLASAKPADTPAAVLERMRIHYRVKDAQQTGLPDGAIDFIVSSGVLEYVPKQSLPRVLREFHRVAAPGAIMSHRLNLVDQYSYFDKNITAFNFLRFTERQWAWLDSPLMSQNRLRIHDYRKLLREAGFDLVKEESVAEVSQNLDRIKLAPEFQRVAREDLLVVHSFISARRRD